MRREDRSIFSEYRSQGARPADGPSDTSSVAKGASAEPFKVVGCPFLALDKRRGARGQPRSRIFGTLSALCRCKGMMADSLKWPPCRDHGPVELRWHQFGGCSH